MTWKNTLEHLVSKFYESEDTQEIIEQLNENDKKGETFTISLEKGLTIRQIEFLNVIADLRYIDTCKINIDNSFASAELKMLDRFQKYFKADMQREKNKQDFMGLYGDPIAGLDVRKSIVVFYPTYFTVKRIIFVVVTLSLWHRPGI